MTLFLESWGVPHATPCPAHLGLPQLHAAGESWRSSTAAGDTALVLPCGGLGSAQAFIFMGNPDISTLPLSHLGTKG